MLRAPCEALRYHEFFGWQNDKGVPWPAKSGPGWKFPTAALIEDLATRGLQMNLNSYVVVRACSLKNASMTVLAFFLFTAQSLRSQSAEHPLDALTARSISSRTIRRW